MQTQTVETTTDSLTKELDNESVTTELQDNSSDDSTVAVEGAVEPVPLQKEELAGGAIEVVVGVLILTVGALVTARLLRKN